MEFTRSIDSTKDTKQALPSLPWELLRLIFEFAIPPKSLMMPERWRYSAWSLNLVTIQYLISVCRDWYQVGIDLLYADIAVYWVAQLSALERTLRNNSELAAMVISIQVARQIPFAELNVFDSTLDSLIKLCPKLSRFSLDDCLYVSQTDYMSFFITYVPLTHLCICNGVFFITDLSNELRPFAEQLLSFTIYPEGPNQYPISIGTEPLESRRKYENSFLSFPRLTHFHCSLGPSQMEFISNNWGFHVLTFFAWFILHEEFFPDLSFVEKHKHTITTLLLSSYSPHVGYDHQKLLGEMQNLRHLIIDDIPTDLSLPQIHHLDLIQPWGEPPPSIENQSSRFPNLITYRSVDDNLLSLPWIYTHIHPSVEDYRQFRFPGINIQANSSSLWGTSSSESNTTKIMEESLGFSSDLDLDWVQGSSESESESSDSDWGELEDE